MLFILDRWNLGVSIFLAGFTDISFILNSISIYIFTRPKFLKESIFRYFLVNQQAAVLGSSICWFYTVPLLTKWDIF